MWQQKFVDIRLVIVCLLIAAEISLGLRNVFINVPSAVRRGDNVTLFCNYDMENDTLYSVKWYKGKREFFRYVPKDPSPVKIFSTAGLIVEKSQSNQSQVTLISVALNVSGKFSCEVSADAPSFHTQVVSGEMEIIELPAFEPTFTGVHTRYRMGDILRGNCSSDYSKPAANLTWIVNDVPVMEMEFHVNIIHQSYDYELKVGKTIYDMKLIYLPKGNKDIDIFIHNFLFVGEFSFLLASTLNLYVSEKNYPKIQTFIRKNQLEPDIIGRETKPGLIFDISGSTNITVVTFKKRIDQYDILQKFMNFLFEHSLLPPPSYYQTVAFPWLQRSQLRHFCKPIPQKTFFIIHQFLICLRELSYDREPHANIFDLCNLKLAFCDDRGMNEQEEDLAFEIDALIIRSIKQLKMKTCLFENNQFDVYTYIRDRQIIWRVMIINYFQYTFQDYFDSIKTFEWYSHNSSSAEYRFAFNQIKLVDYPDLEIVKQKSNSGFIVDCINFDQMDLFKFINLLKCRNIGRIILDTNHKWLVSNQPNYLLILSWIIMLMEHSKTTFKIRTIVLSGNNIYNFVEDFLFALKKFPIWPHLMLHLSFSLKNYAVFNGTKLSEIIFYNTTLDSSMLKQLSSCKLNSAKCSLTLCKLKNERSNWDLIYALDSLDEVSIIEDESTWQCLFEFVENKINESGLKEFTFSKLIAVVINPNNVIQLFKITFVMDSINSKIIMVWKDSNIPIDLYYLKNKIEWDDTDYEFYN